MDLSIFQNPRVMAGLSIKYSNSHISTCTVAMGYAWTVINQLCIICSLVQVFNMPGINHKDQSQGINVFAWARYVLSTEVPAHPTVLSSMLGMMFMTSHILRQDQKEPRYIHPLRIGITHKQPTLLRLLTKIPMLKQLIKMTLWYWESNLWGIWSCGSHWAV